MTEGTPKPIDELDTLPRSTLEEISLRCQRMFRYAELGGQSYEPEVLQEAWETYSKVSSRLKGFGSKSD